MRWPAPWQVAKHVAGYAAIVIAAITVGLYLDQADARYFRAEQKLRLVEQGTTLRAQLERELIARMLLGRGLAVAITATPDLTQARYQAIARQLHASNPDIVNIAAAPDYVVRYIYPQAGNGGVIGHDYRTAANFEAIDQIRVENKPSIFGPEGLLQGGEGFIVRSPVFLYDEVTGQESFWGFTAIVMDKVKFLTKAGILNADENYDIAIRALGDDPSRSRMVTGDPAIYAQDPIVTVMSLPIGTWEIALIPKGGWAIYPPDRARTWQVIGLIAVALLLLKMAADRSRSQRDLAEMRLREAIDVIDDGFVIFDADDRLVMCNEKYRKMHEKSAGILHPGVRLVEIIRAGAAWGQYPEAIGREEEWVQEQLLAHRQERRTHVMQYGKDRWLKLTEHRTPRGESVGLRVDITELKNAVTAAERASQAKTDFLNTISHELRTPLTVILGYNTLLTKIAVTPAAKALIEKLESRHGDADADELKAMVMDLNKEISVFTNQINESGQTLLLLVNHLLDLSEMCNETLVIKRGWCSLDSLEAAIREQFEEPCKARNIRLTTDFCDGQVFADGPRLRQSLLNVVDNAVKFTGAGQVIVSARHVQDGVTFTVQDTGCGIDPDRQDEIFEKFAQLDASGARAFDGAGLGLPIAKHVVELHSGEITVQSMPGQGSIFTIFIPNHPGDRDHVAGRPDMAA